MTNWTALHTELTAWQNIGNVATFWWRDDDTTSTTPPLRTMLDIANQHDVPLALAVIPAHAEQQLSHHLSAETQVTVLQHGFSHENHADANHKKAELGAHRPVEQVLAELATGKQRLEDLFTSPMPVLIPPWNRIALNIAERLPDIGITGLSTFRPRDMRFNGVQIANTHVDIIDWRGTRGFVGLEHALQQTVQHLKARRNGIVDPAEPTGLLTHHLVHEDVCWQFLHDLFSLTQAHPAARWLSAQEIFASKATD